MTYGCLTLAVGTTSVRCTASLDSTVGQAGRDVQGAQRTGCTERTANTGRTVKVYSMYRVSRVSGVYTVRGSFGCMVVFLGSDEIISTIPYCLLPLL